MVASPYHERRWNLFLYHFHCLQSTLRCPLALPTESPFPLSPMLKEVRARGEAKNDVVPHCSTTSVMLPTLKRGGKGQRATTPSQASWVVQLFIPPTVVQTLLSIAQIGYAAYHAIMYQDTWSCTMVRAQVS